jgi:hypothetical protein
LLFFLQYGVFHYSFTKILGFIYKIRVLLDLIHHIREENYDPCGNKTENEAWYRILQDNSRTRDKNRPKWEIVLFHDNQKSTLIFKLSHGLVDGHSCKVLFDTFFNNFEFGQGLNKISGKNPIGFVEKVTKHNLFAVIRMGHKYNVEA